VLRRSEEGFWSWVQVQIDPKVDDQEPIVSVRAKEAQYERLCAEDGTV
jgi:hypothetical protein